MTDPRITEVAILCGGLGTRFRAVDPLRPKTLATIAGRPFLSILFDQFLKAGCEKFILCIGCQADAVESYVRTSPYAEYVLYSREFEPRGTGGAVKLAQNLITGNYFYVANGDSYCPIDLKTMERFHCGLDTPPSLATIALAPDDERDDAGRVVIESNSGKIISFNEKSPQVGHGWINAGIYICDQGLFDKFPAGKNVSLEHEVFPRLTGQGFYGFRQNEPVIDIGTPERYNKAQNFFKDKI